MTKQKEPTTFNLQLDQLLHGESIPNETPDLAFARRLHKADLSPRSRIEASLRARLLVPENSPKFPQVPTISPKKISLPFRLAPTLAFGAAMVLLVLFLAWALTNTTPQPAIPEETTKGFSLLVLDYQGTICCGEGRAEWLDAKTLQASRALNIPFTRGIIAAPDGNVIFDLGYGEATQLFSLDLLSDEQISLVTAPEILTPLGNYPAPFAISPDGKRLVVAHYDFTGEGDAADTTRFWRSVFDLSTHALLYKFPSEPEHVREAETPACLMPIMMISPDNNRLYELCVWGGSGTLGASPTIRAINLQSGEILKTLSVPRAWGAELSPDGSLMYVIASMGEILVLDTQNLETLKTYQYESLVTDYGGGRRTAISQDGMTLFVSTYALTGKHQFFAIDTQSGDIITQIEGDGSIDSIVVAPDDQTVFTLALLEGGKAVVTAHDPVTLEAKYRRVFEGEFIPKRLIGVAVDMVPRVSFETSTTTTLTSSLPGDLFFLLRPTSPPFYYQWAHLPAFCLEDRVDCDLQMLPALPNGEAIPDATLSWSPDGTRAIFFNPNLQMPKIVELNAGTGEWREILVEFWVVQEKYFWTFDSQWVAFQAQGEGAYTSYIGFFNPSTGEFRKLSEVPGEEREPLAWLNEQELIVQLIRPGLDGQQTFPDVRYVLLNVQTGQETDYHRFDSLGLTTWGSNDVLSPDYQWWASPVTSGLQTEIVLMRGDGSENHTVFKGDGSLNGPIIWLNNNYLFVQLYNEQVERNHLYRISLTDNTTQEIFLPGLDTSAFDVSQVSFRPVAEPPFESVPAEAFPIPTPFTPVPPIGDTPADHPNPALSALTFEWESDDTFSPAIYYGDIYAGDTFLGRAEFGENPGGWCDRSWNGVLLAFNYVKDGLETLRWVSIKDLASSQALPGYDLHSPVTFAPNDFRVAFMGCVDEDCGLYVFDLDQGGAVKIGEGETVSAPAWSPDGQYIVIWDGAPINDQGIQNVKVVHAETGEVLYMGDPTLDGSPLQAWGMSVMYKPFTSTQRCEAPPDTISSEPIPPSPDGTYTVQEGDTLAGIANQFGLAVDVLLSLNGLTSDTTLFAGQVLVVAPPLNIGLLPGLVQSDLDFVWTFTGNSDQPNANADIYAEDQYLGQVDFGVIDAGGEPGGWCVRSFDGKWIAFAYRSPNVPEMLHWFDVENLSQVYELPDYAAVMSMAFSPTANQLVFTGCGDNCGLWLFDLETGEIRKLYAQGNINSAPSLWSPDGQSIAFLPSEGNPMENGAIPNNIVVLRAENGEVIYEGYAYAAESPLIGWGTSLPDFSDVEGTTGCETVP